MISKNEFVTIINKLMKIHEAEDMLHDALKILSDDFCNICFFAQEDIIVKLLENMFHDEDTGWISYCLYEVNDFKDCHDGMVKDADGNNIPLNNAGELYDLLMSNIHNKND